MKIIFFLFTICCLTSYADFFFLPLEWLQFIPEVGMKVLDLARGIVSIPIEITRRFFTGIREMTGYKVIEVAKDAMEISENIFSGVANIGDLIFNRTIFPIIPDARRVIPKLAKILKNFPIIPGTHWCGHGNIAHNDELTGIAEATDLCCREHDHCPDVIRTGECKHDLSNKMGFTRSNCECDIKLFKCLKAVFSPLAIATGLIYFSLLGPMCFKKDYPIAGCQLERFRRCVKYKFNYNEEPIYQWFDNPVFE